MAKKWKGFKDVQATIIVDVSKNEEDLFNSVERSRKKNIKKAIREGLKFVEAKDEEEWREWYKIHSKVWREGGVKKEDFDKFKKTGHRLFLVKKNEKIIGGGVFEEFENKIIFRAYASLIEYQNLRPNDFLYWNSFLYAKKIGKNKVDLGGWQINAWKHLKGINSFKEKWGGEITYYNIYNKNPFYILGRKGIRNFKIIRWVWDRIKRRPKVRKDFGKENKTTYKTKGSIEHYSSLDHIYDVEKDLIKKYFRGKIMDLGCGVGRITKYIYKEGYNVVGVDIIEKMIKKSKENYPEIKFEVGDACNLKYANNNFDVIFFPAQGIDYIFPESNRIKALKEIERVLNRGGYFIYSSHNPLKLFFKFRLKFFLRNIFKGTLFSKYKNENPGFGELYTYYGSPQTQKKLIKKNTNLKFVEMVVPKSNNLFPHYVFKKI